MWWFFKTIFELISSRWYKYNPVFREISKTAEKGHNKSKNIQIQKAECVKKVKFLKMKAETTINKNIPLQYLE